MNQDNYLSNVLIDILTPWAEQHFGKQCWAYQQDSAPAHRAKVIQEWYQENFFDFITSQEWPPYSPDLNPLDYSVWSVLEAKACSKRHANLESLKAFLQKAWDEIDEEYLRITVDAFPKRRKACIDAKRG